MMEKHPIYLMEAIAYSNGLPLDGEELQLLRRLKAYIRTQPYGEDECRYYDEIAPKIVAAIYRSENPEHMLRKTLYTVLFEPTVEFLRDGREQEAHKYCRRMLIKLKEKYL